MALTGSLCTDTSAPDTTAAWGLALTFVAYLTIDAVLCAITLARKGIEGASAGL